MSNKSYKYLYEKYKIKYIKLKINNVLIGGGKPNWLIEMSSGNIKINNKMYIVSKDSFYLEQQYKEKNSEIFKLLEDGPKYKLNINENSGIMILKDINYNLIRVYKNDENEYIPIINKTISSEQFDKVSSEQFDKVSSEQFDKVSSEKPKKVSVEKPKKVSVEKPKKVSVKKPKKNSVEKPKKVSVEKPKKVSVEKPKKVSVEKPKKVSVEKPKKIINKKEDVKVINKKEYVKKEYVKKEDVKKEDIKKEDIKKEDIKKEDIKKEDVKYIDDSDDEYDVNKYLIDDSDEDMLENENKYIIDKEEVKKQTENYINITNNIDTKCKNKEEEEIIRNLSKEFLKEKFNPLEQSASYDSKYVLGDIILFSIEGIYHYGYIFKIRNYIIYLKNKDNKEFKIDLRYSNHIKKI